LDFLELSIALYDLLRGETLPLSLVIDLLLHRKLSLLVLGSSELGSVHALAVRLVLVVGAENGIPPPEGGAVVVHERHVVEVVMIGAGPEGEDVLERPWEVVAGVGIDGLEETEGDPDVHGHHVEVLHEVAPEEGSGDGAEAKDGDLGGVSVFGGKTKGCGVFMVDLVDALVQETSV
jgi:hypothetical protein